MSTTWRISIAEEMEEYAETWDDVVSCTLSNAELDESFDDGFGIAEGEPFTVWTIKRVYFPTDYDGAESVRSVARNPDGIPTKHI